MKKIIVISGASRGIGENIARKLAEDGNTIIGTYNNSADNANEIKKDLEKRNISIDFFKADVSKRDEVKKLIEYVLKKYGKIDVLINNAGISQIKMFKDITDTDWEKMMQTNLFSVFYMIQESLENMIQHKDGCIINISSIWGITGASCESHYSASKAGIDALTKSLAKELGPSNIRINSIAPGIIETKMNEHLKKEEIEKIKEEIPLERCGKPEDISRCIEWLIEDKYVTGQVISVNGGWLI